MKLPPFLLGATLVFWGWQTGFLLPGLVMAAALEGARWFRPNWELSNEDYARVWTFCTVLCLAATVFAFTTNEGLSEVRDFLQNPRLLARRNGGVASARTFAALFRWLPMLFFLFMGAQACSARQGIPLETISLILRWRWKRARRLGLPPPPSRSLDISYPYFALCLFSASNRPSENGVFFWGLCLLLAWALWPQRSRRAGFALWGTSLALAVTLGYFGQHGIGRLQNYLASMNPQWFGNFSHRRFDPTHSQTELGQLGQMKASARIVLRLEAKQGPVPARLREASYRTFKGRTWSADLNETDFTPIQPDTNGTTYVLVPGKTNASTLRIACYLEGGKALLPLPSGTARLQELTAYILQRNPLGAVLEEGPGLVLFDACHGPGATFDSPANTNEDLVVPAREAPALDQVIAELGLQHQPPAQVLPALNAFFLNRFTYTTYQEFDRWTKSEDTPLTRFLLRSRAGHCEYFATAGVLLLRRLNIPARYAVGYAVHEGSGRNYVVRQKDAHAWCLVWDAQAGLWREFDPTPGSWIAVEAAQTPALQGFWDAWSWLSFQFSRFRWGQNHWRQYVLWAMVPVLVVLLYQIIFHARRRRRDQRRGPEEHPAWPGLDSEFYQLEQKLAARGLPRRPSEPLSSWLARTLEAPGLGEVRAGLQNLLLLHYRYRFDPQGLTADERQELRRVARGCLERMQQTVA